MRQETSFLKRFIAMALALLLLVSNANLGAVLQVSAAEHDHDHADPTKTYGQIIAENYDLTEAEKNLLTSGMLAGDGTFSYQVPADGDNLIAIDTDAKKITVAKFGDWAIDHAYIMVGNEVKETVTMTNGVGTYTFDGKAFSVKVDFTLNTEIAKDVQETLLNTAAWLKQGIANLKAISNQSGNLDILETAMPELVKIANDDSYGLNQLAVREINNLNDQMTANGGKLDLSVLIDAYNAAPSKVQYLLTNGAAMKAEVEELTKDRGPLYYIERGLSDAIDMLVFNIEDAEAQLSDAKAEAEQKIAEAEAELNNARQQIADAEQKIADAEKELADIEEKLPEAKEALADAQTALDEVNEALQYATGDEKAELEATKADLENAIAEINQKLADYEEVKAEVADAKAKLEEGKTKLADAEAEFNAQMADYEAKLADAEAQIKEANETLDLAEMLYGCVSDLYAGLKALVGADWTVLDADKGAKLLKTGITDAEYVALDKLVAELGEASAVTVKETLWVADASVQMNMSMFNVNVKVVLNTVQEENKIKEFGAEEVVLTLAKDATEVEILAEIAASGIEADALEAWAEVYVADKFVREETELPATLTADVDYVITYSPVEFQVTLIDKDQETEEDEMLPYGYQYELPKHADSLKAYDYYIEDEKYAQGTVITIEDVTVIEREEGAAYNLDDLYNIVAKNFGDDLAKEILTSGALLGNEVVAYRVPKGDELVVLQGGMITAQTDVDSDYENNLWQPYSYGKDGNENLFAGNTASWDGKDVMVQYRLNLKNISKEEAQAILDLAKELKTAANNQKSTLDALANYHETMGQLNGSILGAMKPIVASGDYGKSAEENKVLGEYFAAQIDLIINNNVDTDNNLKLYNILTKYKDETNGGLYYYYTNSQTVIDEINSLAGPISAMAKESEALKYMLLNNSAFASFAGYADKIDSLDAAIKTAQENLTAPHEKIDLSSSNLDVLMDALKKDGIVGNLTAGIPYLDCDPIAVLDSSNVNITVTFKVPGKNETSVSSGSVLVNEEALTQEILDDLYKKIDAKVKELLGEKAAYYVLEQDGEIPTAGVTLSGKVKVTYSYTPIEYTVKIDGEADKTFTIENTQIILPTHPDPAYRYDYTIGSKTVKDGGSYRFTTAELDALFAQDNAYTITRVAVNIADEKLDGAFGDWLVKDAAGNVTGLNAKVSENVMDFAMTLINSGYSYIALGGEDLLYKNDGGLVIKLQTLVNALMNDSKFTNETLIALGKNGKGEFLHAPMQLGYMNKNAETGNWETDVVYSDLEFVLSLESVPAQMATVAAGLERIKSYMTFQANEGVMDVNLTLPEKVYEAYLTALLASATIDKENIAAINDEIAFQFLWDYVDVIINSDADVETFENTLAMLGIDRPLPEQVGYYPMLKKVLTNDGVVINPDDENSDVDLSATAKGQKAINALISLLGVNVSEFESVLDMILEYNDASAEISVKARANLTNTDTVFEAVVVDFAKLGLSREYLDREHLNKENLKEAVSNLDKETLKEMAKGYDFAANAAARISEITGESMVMLLSDVNDNLVFNGSAILDLNGKTVNGNIIVNDGTLIIIDSTLGDATAGIVNGNIGGNVKIMAGQYAYDVSDLLVTGYVYEDGYVHNQLYIMSADVTTTYGLNAADIKNIAIDVKTKLLESGKMDYIEFAVALSADVAVDMIFNYLNSAAFAIATDKYVADGEHYDTNNDGFHDVYDIQFTDLIGLLESSNKKADLVQKVLDSINIDELDGFVNEILYDLLDFATIKAAIENDDVIASYGLKTSPFMVQVEHITDGDYLTFGITSNPAKIKYSNIGLKVGSETARKYLLMLVEELDRIVKVGKAEVKLDEIGTTVNARGVEIPVVNGGATVDFRVDLTAGDYDYVGRIAEILGRENNEAFKAAFDATSLGDIVDKLESYIEANSKIEGRVEDIALDVLNVVTKVLKRLDIEDKNFGILETEEYGAYDIGPVVKHGENRVRGIFENIDLNVYLWVKLFKKDVEDEDCTHVPGEIVIENEVAADCVNDGSYDEVVYCTVCGEELSRNTITVPALGHTEAAAVIENEVAADCVNDGSYDEVVYCSVCGEELSRTTVVVDALGHTEAAAVIENEVAADCVNDGSYDEVVYCSVCGEELSRKTVIVDALGHTAGETVIENKVDADCVTDGSYDEVVYCSVCGEELSRETIVVDALGHTAGEIVIENRVDSTCTVAGSYDEVVYCEVCDEELSRETKTLPLAEHTAGEVEIENEVEPDCVTEGSYDEVVYCSVCGEELSRETIVVDALGHTAGEIVIENRVESTCTEAGSYDEVVYCDVCGEELSRETVKLPLAAHVDEDPRDHICDICGAGPLEDCYDHDLDGFCDWCGRYICKCGVDEDRDHHCDICGRRISWCRDCDRDHYCDICGLQLTCCIDFNRNNKCDICGKYMNTVGEVIRIGGDVRSETARMIADELKAVLGVDKFDAIVYAVGDVYADALTGTYLANMENAPILLYRAAQVEKNLNYIVKNLSADGVVYILGDVGAIPASVEEGLVAAGIKVVRLGGLTRYETNLEILDATVFDGGETVLVCTGNEYPDALAASATGMPILLVNNKIGHLKDSQIEYLNSLANKCNFVLIGGEGAISPALAAELAGYDADGTVDRIGGKTRYETCAMIADAFFADAEKVVVAYGREFPDALCGGTLAYALNAPIILVQESRATFAAFYLDSKDINSGYVLGGAGRISDKVACKVFRLVGPHEMIVR